MSEADKMFEKLGYRKKELDIIFNRFWEQYENENYEKIISFNTEYKYVDITDENEYGLDYSEITTIYTKMKEFGWSE